VRSAAALFLLAVAAGCRSARESAEPEAGTERARHDYLSANRAGLAFVGDTSREGRRMRRENLRTALQVSRRERANREQRRLGRKFALESVFAEPWKPVRDLWRNVKSNAHENLRGDAYDRRFGFLDSGD
jgi:hypothetical protein